MSSIIAPVVFLHRYASPVALHNVSQLREVEGFDGHRDRWQDSVKRHHGAGDRKEAAVRSNGLERRQESGATHPATPDPCCVSTHLCERNTAAVV